MSELLTDDSSKQQVEQVDVWEDPPVEFFDQGERFGTASEMIAEIRRLRADGSGSATPAPSSDLTLSDLRQQNASRAEQWNGGNPAPLDFAMMELAGETGEACNAAKKLARLERGWPGGADTRDNLAEELADVVICADLAAMRAGIDLSSAVITKFNTTSEKHGFPQRLGQRPAPRLSTEAHHEQQREAEAERIGEAIGGSQGEAIAVPGLPAEERAEANDRAGRDERGEAVPVLQVGEGVGRVAPPSNLTGEATPEPSDAKAIDRIVAYLKRNGYVEVTIWSSGGAVYRREHLHDALAQAERDRDEADRRAGAAERRNAEYVESEDRHQHWLRERKRERGVSESQSFDVLWDDTCKLADAYHTIRESLGMGDDTDPQEVVDAVGRMREALNSLRLDVERAHVGMYARCKDCDVCRSLDMAEAALAAQRKEGEQNNPDLQNLRPGQHVRFHPIIGGKHDGNTYVVRHANSAGVWLEGKPGMVAWSAVTPITEFAPQRKEMWECPQCGSSQWEADGSPECKTIWCADGCGFHTNPGDATYPAAQQRKEGE